jgi:hypothetical protein
LLLVVRNEQKPSYLPFQARESGGGGGFMQGRGEDVVVVMEERQDMTVVDDRIG